MKQVLQDLRTGRTEVADVPCPAVGSGQLLLRSKCTLVSAGTERMLVDFGRAGWLEKARQQPDKVRMVLAKIKTDGIVPTLEAVLNKLGQPLPMGYCNVGEVAAVGPGVRGFAIGDRVASNGRHAEMVAVPVNLCAKVPAPVSDDSAAFTVLGSIALQGIRLAQPTLGETIVVTGLGLIGLLTVQLLRAQGCRVLGIDFDAQRLELARRFGAEAVDASTVDVVAAAATFSRGRGVDAVLITAATESNEPVRQAAQMCRKRGRIVLVGVAGLELSRADFYEKELTFQVSCSYGPGRYDPTYETDGVDYPVGYVRWTEQRNFEAVLDMLAEGRLDVQALISHRFALADAESAYALVGSPEPSLGILLDYPGGDAEPLRTVGFTVNAPGGGAPSARSPAVSFIGAGNYATGALIPAFKRAGAALRAVVSASGVSGVHAARKYGFEEATTDAERVFADPSVGAVVIATRHDSHADLVCRALVAGKHVFVEKPLALDLDELRRIASVYEQVSAAGRRLVLMVGFNRRFAPQVRRIQELLAGVAGPKAFVMTVNAGAIAPGHWTQNADVGGGRIIGEGCHFIDLLRHLAGARIIGQSATKMDAPTGDTVTLSLQFADGSIGTVHYLANGSKAFPKERLEIFVGGRVLQLDNFRRLRGFGWPRFKSMNLWRQDKGQHECARAFVDAVKSGSAAPIAFDELIEVARVTIAAEEAVRA